MTVNKKTRYIFFTGGVVSSLGKGLACASLGALLQARGYSVRLRKLDPYLNVDPGTMSPTQHGEVFVTEDGAETDLDLGHYERFTGVDAKAGDNLTTGKVYSKILAKERKGDYLGGTVQVIPHVTDEIKQFISSDKENVDFVLCEIGGTVGDIEALPFLEATRQMTYTNGTEAIFVHLTLVPYLAAAKELKTKPTQHSVKELRSIGIQPNIILCRSEKEIPQIERQKIALFCNIKEDSVLNALDVKTIYEAPVAYHNVGFDVQVLKKFNLPYEEEIDLSTWDSIIDTINNAEEEVTIAIVGKYIKLKDAYKSIIESFTHAGIANKLKVKLVWINSRTFMKDNVDDKLKNVNAILVPGGFGGDGIEGKLAAIRYARENKIPFLGICLGMQLSIVEAARNICGIEDAVSSEFDKEGKLFVGLMSEWSKGGEKQLRNENSDLGGTMRLGSYNSTLKEDTLAYSIYGQKNISERHRHRYEVNTNYTDILEKNSIVFSGMSEDGKLPEIMEYKNHPWFLGVQFHPELKSRPFKPHPIFVSFVEAAYKYSKNKNKKLEEVI